MDEYQLHRMLLGLPEGMEELVPVQALPLESSMDIHGGGECRNLALQRSYTCSPSQSISEKVATWVKN